MFQAGWSWPAHPRKWLSFAPVTPPTPRTVPGTSQKPHIHLWATQGRKSRPHWSLCFGAQEPGARQRQGQSRGGLSAGLSREFCSILGWAQPLGNESCPIRRGPELLVREDPNKAAPPRHCWDQKALAVQSPQLPPPIQSRPWEPAHPQHKQVFQS